MHDLAARHPHPADLHGDVSPVRQPRASDCRAARRIPTLGHAPRKHERALPEPKLHVATAGIDVPVGTTLVKEHQVLPSPAAADPHLLEARKAVLDVDRALVSSPPGGSEVHGPQLGSPVRRDNDLAGDPPQREGGGICDAQGLLRRLAVIRRRRLAPLARPAQQRAPISARRPHGTVEFLLPVGVRVVSQPAPPATPQHERAHGVQCRVEEGDVRPRPGLDGHVVARTNEPPGVVSHPVAPPRPPWVPVVGRRLDEDVLPGQLVLAERAVNAVDSGEADAHRHGRGVGHGNVLRGDVSHVDRAKVHCTDVRASTLFAISGDEAGYLQRALQQHRRRRYEQRGREA
mmetsp:Transcript_35707/g.76258  ORF Transcript_35707/g.76258 Transcript_35707/m.76258 type:complete len:346 (-) Transcript_35707:368-1405(-)